MVSFISSKSWYAVAALKAMSNALDIEEESQNATGICDYIVNNCSLQYLFPIMMGLGIKGKDGEEQGEINEHILRIIYFLVRHSVGISR
jgi:hypothetical protein